MPRQRTEDVTASPHVSLDDAIGYFDELAQTRETLGRRFDDLESGSVDPIDGEDAYRRLLEKTEHQRRGGV